MNILNDLRFALRTMLKDRTLTSVAILTLAFALGANTAIFTVVNAILLRPLPFEKPQQIVEISIIDRLDGSTSTVLSLPNILDLAAQSKTLQPVAALARSAGFVWRGDEPIRVRGVLVTSSLFPLLRVKPELGRVINADDDREGAPPVIVLSHSLWKSVYGGDRRIVGKQIRWGTAGKSHTVIGVMPEAFVFPLETDGHDFWLPLRAEMTGPNMHHRGAAFIDCYARIRDGVTLDQVRAELAVIGARLEAQYPDDDTGLRFLVEPLHAMLVKGVRPALLMLFGAVLLVLLIGCANVANLLLARAAARRREMAIRAAVGATRGRIVTQLLVESVLLALVAGACGVLLAMWGLDVLIALAPPDIPRLESISLDGGVLAFTLALSVLTGIVFGLAPALAASRTDLNETLKEGTRGSTEGRGRQRVRNVLVTAAVAMSLVLLVGAGLLLRSFMRASGVDPGFDFRDTAYVEVSARQTAYKTPEQAFAFARRLLGELAAIPGVQSTGAVDLLPLGRSERTWTFQIAGKPRFASGHEPSATTSSVTPNYFRTMSIPILRGRDFSDRDDAHVPKVMAISETFARRWFANEDPIGQAILLDNGSGGEDAYRIIALVGDIHYRDLTTDPVPMFYMSAWQGKPSRLFFLARARNAAAMLPAMRGVVRNLDRDQPINSSETMAEVRGESLATRRFNMVLLGLLAALALILAAVGIYSIMAYTVTQRTSEIGIRMALGAGTSDVFRLIVGNALRIVAIGVAAGVAVALAATRVMASLVFGVGTNDPLTFAGICALIAAVALVASWVPARRATRVDPLVAIRYD
jgi:putative ABC transport system permease protein